MKPGSDEAALYVHGVGGLVVPEADDITVFDGDAAVDDPPGKDVDDPGVGEQQIAGGIPLAVVMIGCKSIMSGP
jgi:hypothetical protein